MQVNVLEKLVGIEGGLVVNQSHDLKCPQGYHEVKEDQMEIKMKKCTIKTQAKATIDMASITLK